MISFLHLQLFLPELIGNPLYIWCALELKRYFDIDVPVNGENAEKISIVRRNGSYRKSTLRGGGAWSIRMWNCYLRQRIRWMI
ncbi:MAG: glucuronate isomerase [Waltera sp.]